MNLIGEHIDYHGYSVLPMALQQDTVIAVAPGTPGGPVRVANTNGKYATATLPTDPAAAVDQSEGVRWFQYVQCGYKGAFDFGAAKGCLKGAPLGICMMVDGRVPPGAGVSSSSALTVASLLAVARANGIDAHMTRAELGEAGRNWTRPALPPIDPSKDDIGEGGRGSEERADAREGPPAFFFACVHAPPRSLTPPRPPPHPPQAQPLALGGQQHARRLKGADLEVLGGAHLQHALGDLLHRGPAVGGGARGHV